MLIDRRNAHLIPDICKVISTTGFIGLDVETQDDKRHEGLNLLMKVNGETRRKPGNTKLVFDMRRTVCTGFSIYPEGHEESYYFNLDHADVENRLTWDEVRPLLDAKGPGSFWVAHNANYELTVFKNCFDYDLPEIICTLQLSVTAFGDDNYDIQEWKAAGLGNLQNMIVPLYKACVVPNADPEARFNRQTEELIQKITSKTSDATTSYNGFVKDLSFGHGLKSLVLKFFGHKMGSFAETLGTAAHMGQLTGDEVAEYGAEDAYWVIPLFRYLMKYVAENSPEALPTFFTQENPMTQVFSELWQGGMRVNLPAIDVRRDMERKEFAVLLRRLRAAMKKIPWGDRNENLSGRQPWYDKNWANYRSRIDTWVNLPDHKDDFEECIRVSNAVPNAWASERKDPRVGPLSITHYMVARTIYYDLLGAKLQFDMGKVASDGEARGKIRLTLTDPDKIEVIDCLNAMSGVEQRMKLYLTPYLFMTDPETQCLYPTVNSMLNTRRLAASNPNPLQLAKRGESTYVRGFFLADNDDEVIVSLDWSGIELVIIGELSGDPEYFKAFGQLPHLDLHTGATAAVLGVEMPWITEEMLKSMKQLRSPNDFYDRWGKTPEECQRLFTNLSGESIADCPGSLKFWRTEIGKGANFNYAYSGFLHTIGQKMGWSLQTTSLATDLYREKFSVMEDWRVDVIHQAQANGFVQLPDGHRRFRYEATGEFMEAFKAKWPVEDAEFSRVVHEIARRINKRAQNQSVNALIQGTCATLLKRSILRLRDKIKAEGWKARFMIPIHDELVFSVNRNEVAEFIAMTHDVMTNSHGDLFKKLKLDASASVGNTFEPWHLKKAPFGQIELSEPPMELGLGSAALGVDGIREVVKYLSAARC